MDVVTLGMAKADAKKTYATRNKQRAFLAQNVGSLYNRTLDTSATVTHSSTNPLGTNLFSTYNTDQVTYLGAVPGDVPGSGFRYNAVNDGGIETAWGVTFSGTGTDFVVNWYCQAASNTQMWIFIDGKPTTAAPAVPSGSFTLTTAVSYYTQIHFAAAGHHNITILWGGCRFKSVIYNTNSGIQAAPSPFAYRLAVLGDSYTEGPGGYGASLIGYAANLAFGLGAEPFICGQSSTGYVNDGGGAGKGIFGMTTRVNQIVAAKPDLVIISGSVNDDTYSYATIKAAAAALYATLNTQLPGVPVITVGPQCTDPSKSTGFTGTRQANIQAVRDASNAAPNVIGFIETCGIADAIPGNYTNGAAYAAGAVSIWQGGVYKARAAIATAPASLNPPDWKLVSYLTGTGNAASPNGTGSRDILLASDSTHPTPLGHINYGAWLVPKVQAILTAH